MKKLKAAIVSNGSITDYTRIKKIISDEYDFIIGVDGGNDHIRKMDITPNMIVGDLDSISEDTFNYFTSLGVEVQRFPKAKDATDTHLAIDIALKRGAKLIGLFGCTGNRLDHALSNIYHLLYIRDNGSVGKLTDDFNIAFLADKETEIKGNKGDTVSLIPLSGKADGITLEGFMYPLNNATLKCGDSWGVSNVLTKDRGVIFKEKGELLIIINN